MSHVLPVHSEHGQGQAISQQGPEGTKLVWQRISQMASDILERWCFARSQWSLSEELWTSITPFIHYHQVSQTPEPDRVTAKSLSLND